MAYEDGLAVWDALRSTGVMPVGVETYANTRRMEKSLRLQNADLLTEYNLLEADLARPKVKEADFRGKQKHLEYRAREHQPAMLCTLVMTENTDAKGVARYPVGIMPVMDPETGETLVDECGRRSFTTSIAYGPTIGKNIALAYLPWSHCQEGRKLCVDYFGETFPVEVAAVGYKPLYDPENLKPKELIFIRKPDDGCARRSYGYEGRRRSQLPEAPSHKCDGARHAGTIFALAEILVTHKIVPCLRRPGHGDALQPARSAR